MGYHGPVPTTYHDLFPLAPHLPGCRGQFSQGTWQAADLDLRQVTWIRSCHHHVIIMWSSCDHVIMFLLRLAWNQQIQWLILWNCQVRSNGTISFYQKLLRANWSGYVRLQSTEEFSRGRTVRLVRLQKWIVVSRRIRREPRVNSFGSCGLLRLSCLTVCVLCALHLFWTRGAHDRLVRGSVLKATSLQKQFPTEVLWTQRHRQQITRSKQTRDQPISLISILFI